MTLQEAKETVAQTTKYSNWKTLQSCSRDKLLKYFDKVAELYANEKVKNISSSSMLTADAAKHELDLEFVKEQGGIPQDNENEGD